MERYSLDGIWTHKRKGTKYRVLAVSNTKASPEKKAEFPVTVFFQDQNNEIWSRPAEVFLDKFERKEEDQRV